MLILLLLACLQRNNGLLQKQTTLDAHTSSQSGASITHNPQTTSIDLQSSVYNVVVTDQETAYDLKLSLNDSWAFQQQTVSQLTITAQGGTPFPATDTDLLFVFSVSDWQYFSFFIHLDSMHNIKSRIYSSLDRQHITRPVSEWISDTATHSRWDRVSNHNQWQTVAWNKQALWPLKFVIINDPFHDETVFQFYHNTTAEYATGFTLTDAFVTDQALDIYIMGDSINEMYSVSSIDILSQHQYPTTNPPRSSTTDFHTMNPTKISTRNPSVASTNLESSTKQPTNSVLPLDSSTNTVIPLESSTNSILPLKSSTNQATNSAISSTKSSTNAAPISTILATESRTSQQSTIGSQTVEYRMMIKVTFECNLSLRPCKNEQLLMLLDITERIVNETCTNANVTSVQHGQKLVTSAVFMCGEMTPSDVYSVNNAESELQYQLIQNLHKQTDIEIIKVMVLADHFTLVDIDNTADGETEAAQSGKKASDLPVQYEILLWTMKLIAIQLVLCCLMSICVFALKLKTKRLKERKAKIVKMRTFIKDSKKLMKNAEAMKIASDTAIFANDNSVSCLCLAEVEAAASANAIPLCSTTVESKVTATPSTYASIETHGDDSTVAPIMMRILRNEAEKFVPQSTESSILKSEETSTLISSSSELAMDRRPEPLANVVIVSDAGTWDTDCDTVPSIPPTVVPSLPLFRCDLGSSRSIITKTEKMSGIRTKKTLSPTYTFSGPCYVRDGRERVIL